MSAMLRFVDPSAKRADDIDKLLQKQKMHSSTALQVCLYYNFYFSIMYTIMNILIIRWKHLNYSEFRLDFLVTLFFPVWVISEACRLYAGYMGNLHEQVPHMFAFAFLTLFPQPFISYFLAYIQTPILPFERILNMMYLSVLLVEFGLGYRAGKNIISIKTARFAVQYREQHMGETGEAGRHAQARSRDDHHSSTKLYSRPGSPDRASSSMPSSSSASSSVSSSAAMMRGSAHARSAMSPSYGMGGAGLPRGAPQPIIPPAGNRGASTSASSAYYRNRANRSHKEGIEMQSLRRKEGRGRGRSDSDHSLMTDDGERVDLGVTHISESEVYSQLLFKERELKRELARVRRVKEREERKEMREQWNTRSHNSMGYLDKIMATRQMKGTNKGQNRKTNNDNNRHPKSSL